MSELLTIADVIPLMQDELADCPQALLLQHLYNATRELCERTMAFREKITNDLTAGILSYTITPSWDCEIKRIQKVWLRTAVEVTNNQDGTLQDPMLYRFDLPSTLTLNSTLIPHADVTAGLRAEVSLVPFNNQSGTNVVSPEFLNQWFEGIMYRAYFTLMKMPKQRWSNPQAAGYYNQEFFRKVTDAMAEAQMLHTTNTDPFTG